MLLCIEYSILFVNTVDTKIKACNALNAMFVKTVDTTVKTHPHIPAHNFLNIQWIFNPQKVLDYRLGVSHLFVFGAYLGVHINSVDKQDTLLNTQCIACTLLTW